MSVEDGAACVHFDGDHHATLLNVRLESIALLITKGRQQLVARVYRRHLGNRSLLPAPGRV